MLCSKCGETKTAKGYSPKEWQKWGKSPALCKICKQAAADALWEEEAKKYLYACGVCQRGFATQQAKDDHEFGCGLTAEQKEAKWKAMAEEGEKKYPYACGVCQRGFATQQGRGDHQFGCGLTAEQQEAKWKTWSDETLGKRLQVTVGDFLRAEQMHLEHVVPAEQGRVAENDGAPTPSNAARTGKGRGMKAPEETREPAVTRTSKGRGEFNQGMHASWK